MLILGFSYYEIITHTGEALRTALMQLPSYTNSYFLRPHCYNRVMGPRKTANLQRWTIQ
jgi:hypothetical protein